MIIFPPYSTLDNLNSLNIKYHSDQFLEAIKIPRLQSASELYRPSYRRLSVKLVPTLADRGCRVVSATNPHGR
jgi:hypothetical protein